MQRFEEYCSLPDDTQGLTAFAFSNCEPVVYDESRGDKYLVVGISDGDSIVVVDKNKKRERVRLATIDAPENGQAFGKPSKQSLSQMIYKKYVQLEIQDRDRYGRIVAQVYIGDLNANVEQLKRGFAWLYVAHARDQSPDDRELYERTAQAARDARRGLWKDENPTPPWDYRKKNPRN